MEKAKDHKTRDFLSVTNKADLARVLEVPYKILMYYLYIIPPEEKYFSFEILKRNGKTRQIDAPKDGLKGIQKKLAEILYKLYPDKPCVHGYAKTKDIKTNAIIHSKQRIIINLDLSNFFPTIHFGRVYGMFKAYPFNFTEEIAKTLAQICCHQGILPQGAPSSPIISNYICHKMDNQLSAFSAKYKVYYTRYADDMTFSTNLRMFPPQIATINDNTLSLAEEFKAIIETNGFTINEQKSRFARKNNRQEVTGLIVNSGINVNRKFIREIRAMLHAWEKFGLDKAAHEHFIIHRQQSKIKNIELKFRDTLIGKIGYIGHIKGKSDPVYHRLVGRIKQLVPEISLSSLPSIFDTDAPTVFCEGKTDSLHLQAAFNWFRANKEFDGLNIRFFQHSKDYHINNQELLKVCQTSWSKINQNIIICLFDRDDTSVNNKADEPGRQFKCWKNKVYSVLLPIPPHRDFKEICIEHYYTDKDLMTKDAQGRRIFLSTEFEAENGHHKSLNLIYGEKNRLKVNYPRIIDSDVMDLNNGNKVALSKKDFASNILEKKGAFANISFENFHPLFEIFREIIQQTDNT